MCASFQRANFMGKMYIWWRQQATDILDVPESIGLQALPAILYLNILNQSLTL